MRFDNELKLPEGATIALHVARYLFPNALRWAYGRGLDHAYKGSREFYDTQIDALRSQISQRDASGKFTKKNAS